MNVEAAAVSTDRDEDTTDDVAEEEEDESDAGVIASSEYLPSTPYDSDAEKAA
jgi:hypothetical protein